MDAFPQVAAFVEAACAEAGFDRARRLRVTLVVEELFTNTVRHGHGRDCDEPVEIALAVEPGRVALTYEDTAPPHDPFAGIAPPDEAAAVEARPAGGLGVVLVAGLAQDYAYRHTGGRNRISIVVTAS
jgi:serine/threonine-protein kinase RsbW